MSDILKEAEELFEDAKDGWDENYNAAKDDIQFASPDGEQWDDKDKSERRAGNRPALTINRLPQVIHQVTNDIRMNTPHINVFPEDDEADEETAEAIKEWVRGVEYRSKADAAYDTAMEYAVKGGIGFIRVDHDYTADSGLEQEVLIRRVANPFSVYIDPSIIEVDGSDAEFGFVLDRYTERQWKKKFKGKPSSFCEKEGKKDDYLVAEYFKLNVAEKPMAYFDDGQSFDFEQGIDAREGYRGTRKHKQRSIKRYRLSGEDVLEETDFPGIYIPLIPVFGEEEWIDGKRILRGLVRNAKDPQRMYNLWKSYEAEILQKSPIAPVMAAEGQTEEFAEQWKNPHKSMVLRWKPTDVNGQPVGAPQRLNPAQVPTGMVNASMMAADDIKATTGIYDASLGARGNETSGKAINARQKEGDVSNFHFGDNLVRAVTHTGRVVVGMRQTIVDTKRIVTGVGADDKPKLLGVNGARAGNQQKDFFFNKGKYGVRVSTGASYSTKRQEAAAFMENVVSRDPNMMAIAGDLLVKNMDIPGAEALAERLKMMLPPQVQEMEKAKAAGQEIDPEKIQLKQGMDRAVQEISQLQQALAQCQAELQNKETENQIKMRDLDLKDKELQNRSNEVATQAFQAEAAAGMEDIQPITPERQMARQLEKQENQQFMAQLANMLAEQLQNTAIATNNLAQAAQPKPMQVIRDPQTGAIVGVAPLGQTIQ